MSLAAGAAAKKRRVAAQGSCDAKSKNCKPDIEGLADGLSKLALGAAGDSDAEKDRKLGEALRAVEAKYLAAELTPTQKAKPELVHHITQKFILPNLDNICSGVFYMGSNYEFTTVPGSSDFDIQFCIDIPKTKLNHVKTSSAKAHGCADPAWRMIKGGPEKLQDDKGYLSATKARKAIQSAIDRALQTPSIPPYQGAGIEIRRSTGGPATTLNAEWKGEKVSIDIVVCLRAEDVEESGGHDFVGKPYKGSASNPTGELWRLSYSRKELELLRRFHSNAPRKLLLMRIMKVIKKAQPQLRQFPSYFYKNILFKLEAGKPQPANWDRTGFAQRFKDMVILICESLESQTLMLHFNKQVNLLSSYDKAVVLQTANFLRRLINKNNFIDLPSLVLSKL